MVKTIRQDKAKYVYWYTREYIKVDIDELYIEKQTSMYYVYCTVYINEQGLHVCSGLVVKSGNYKGLPLQLWQI